MIKKIFTRVTSMANGENGNGAKHGYFQWITLMITIIGMNTASILYIATIKERVSVIEERQAAVSREQARMDLQISAMQKIITDGMTMRVVLQSDAINMKKQLDRIEDLLIEHLREGKLSDKKS